MITPLKFDLSDSPPEILRDLCPVPCPGYTSLSYIDLRLVPSRKPPKKQIAEEWLLALRESPVLSNLHEELNVGDLPVNLHDLTYIVNRQRDAGQAVRLTHITAYSLFAWSMTDFHTFALSTTSSLTRLNLGHATTYHDDRASISFAELPAFLAVIRRGLPQLRSLALPVKGIETAEKVCETLLTPDCLEGVGVLVGLTISTANNTSPLFSVIRYIAGHCARTANVVVHCGKNRVWTMEAQYADLRYLRS